MSYPRCAYGGPLANLSLATFPSIQRRTGRVFPQAGGSLIWPIVVPWADASDLYGVAYDAGTVGVVWNNVTSVYSDADILSGLQTNAVPVPGTLPGGYSLRLARDRVAGVAGAINQLASGARKVRTASGFADLAWYPQLGRTRHTNPGYSGHAGGGADTSHATLESAWMGWRGLEIMVAYLGANAPPFTGSATYQISHNADGSTVTGLDGDTIDATFTVNASELVYVGFGGFFTDFHQVGAIKPTLGKPSHYVIRATSNTLTTNLASPLVGNGLTCHGSLRDDIPLPFTCTGRDGDIAPGGVIPGTVPGY